ncbi:hypothetical protein IL252_11180 [Halomicrobium sp. IBSBa]|uniref:Uncharacterized protein n=1 Tax=Halomicrobium mukohataei TaxID=57705 RepID=A0A847UGQ0_9EURY|nr:MULTISPECIES: hypothetical protein [Halomicrobium]MBO4248376.1 hypothetical protein [Halomicrobium sp. IBSBa]NLV10674.1 hypothetical protein [Halomicrobium mukohataei]
MSANGGRDGVTLRTIVETLGPLVQFLRSNGIQSTLGTLFRFLRNPVRFVFSIISFYVLNGILNIVSTVTSAVLGAFDYLVASLTFAQRALGQAFGVAGLNVLSARAALNQIVVTLAASAGPAAPILVIGAGAVTLFLIYRVGIALLGELPVGSSVIDLLGLR